MLLIDDIDTVARVLQFFDRYSIQKPCGWGASASVTNQYFFQLPKSDCLDDEFINLINKNSTQLYNQINGS